IIATMIIKSFLDGGVARSVIGLSLTLAFCRAVEGSTKERRSASVGHQRAASWHAHLTWYAAGVRGAAPGKCPGSARAPRLHSERSDERQPGSQVSSPPPCGAPPSRPFRSQQSNR